MAEVFSECDIAATVPEVCAALREPVAWLEDAARRAAVFGHAADTTLRARFGRAGLGTDLAQRARVEVGEAREVERGLVVPITWEASGFAGLFPVLDALLEIHPSRRGHSHLVFWGRYDPPLGRAGDLIDRLIAHRVAERTVASFLESLERSISLARADPSSRDSEVRASG